MTLTQVKTSGIADDAVTLAKQAAGTDGQIITYDASGNPSAVGPGNDGQVLTSTGAGSPPAFEDAAASVGGASGVDFNDNVKVRLGTGNDAEIYFDASNLYIKETTGTGDIYIESDDVYIRKNGGSETMAGFKSDGAVELYYDNSKKAETVTGGFTVTGACTATSFAGSGSGLTGLPVVSRNLLINGASLIAQANGNASKTGEGICADMWKVSTTASANSATMQVVADGPAGFEYCQRITMGGSTWSPAAGNVCYIQQNLEAQNVAQLAFGTSDAATVTLSFWVKASQTGEYSVALTNNTGGMVHDNSDRNYITSYTISSANTWERKSVTIAGDTSGTWAKTGVGAGMACVWDFGSGSNHEASTGSWQAGADFRKASTANLGAVASATWAITGAQLEVGSAMSDFEHKSFGDELHACQRYYCQSSPYGTTPADSSSSSTALLVNASANHTLTETIPFVRDMRAAPTVTAYEESSAGGGSSGQWAWYIAGTWTYFSMTPTHIKTRHFAAAYNSYTGGTDGDTYMGHINWKASSEL